MPHEHTESLADALMLSGESARTRRLRRESELWLGRRNKEKKKGPGGKPGPKALGNGGVSSREDADRVAPQG